MTTHTTHTTHTTKKGTFTKLEDAEFKSKKRSVYRGINMEDGVEVLWHIVEIDEIPEADRTKLVEDFDQISELAHDNIVTVIAHWVEDNQLNFITELMASGSLNEFLGRPGKLGRNTVGRWCTQILMGLQYLHSRDPPIIHEAISCSSLYFNGNTGQVKIACWDIVLRRTNVKSASAATDMREYIAPEMFEDDEPTPLVDVYGFGMCILQLVTKKKPYSECKSTKEIFNSIQQGILPQCTDSVVDSDIKSMILACLSPKSQRPSPTDLLNSPFLKTAVPGLIQPSKSMEEHKVPPFIQAVDDTDEVNLSHKVVGWAMVSLTIKHNERVIEVHFPYNVKNDKPETVALDMRNQLVLSDDLVPKVQKALQKYVDLYTTPYV